MNIKERVYAAIKFKTVDRIPNTYRAIPYLSKSLLKYFGEKKPDLYRDYKKLIKILGADFYSHGAGPGMFSTFVPECFAPDPAVPYYKDFWFFYALGINSNKKIIPEYDWEYFNPGLEPPLGNIQAKTDIKSDFLMSKINYFDFNAYHNFHDRFKNKDNSDSLNLLKYENIKVTNEDFILMGNMNQIFLICCYLRGMDQFLVDLVSNKELAEHIINEVGQFCIEFNKKELEGFGKKAEWYYMWDDVAGQDGMMFNPEIFKKFFLPIYKKLIENVKKYNLVFSWHCCGNVNDILQSMIDAGIDVFDVVQTSAKDMELEKIHKKFGKSICLHGGIDVQKLLIKGKPEDIKREVEKVKDLWGNRGGMIMAPSHEILPETPIENILAIYENL